MQGTPHASASHLPITSGGLLSRQIQRRDDEGVQARLVPLDLRDARLEHVGGSQIA